VPEDGTSQVCARHGCEVKMEPRGLVKCPYGRAVHSDVNAALNILRRLEGGCRSASKCSASH
jgi:transposase